MDTIDKILEERGSRYGRFDNHALVTQRIKAEIISAAARAGTLHRMQPDQRESLEMIAHKIGRIVNGDPDYADSWDDIAGYAKLVADRLKEQTHD